MTEQDVPEPTPQQIDAYDAGVLAYSEGRPSTSIPLIFWTRRSVFGIRRKPCCS